MIKLVPSLVNDPSTSVMHGVRVLLDVGHGVHLAMVERLKMSAAAVQDAVWHNRDATGARHLGRTVAVHSIGKGGVLKGTELQSRKFVDRKNIGKFFDKVSLTKGGKQITRKEYGFRVQRRRFHVT